MEKHRLWRCSWLMCCCLLFCHAELYHHHIFPMNDCRTSNIDLLIVFENYFSDFCFNQNDDMEFINGVLDVFLAPDEENLTRLHVAVASFSSTGPVMYVPFQNCSRREFVEKVSDLNGCHPNRSPPMEDVDLAVRNIMSSIKTCFTEDYGERSGTKDVVVMIFIEPTFKSSLTNRMYNACFDSDQGCDDNVFFIFELGVDSYFDANSIAINSRSQIALSHVFPKAICHQCKKEWFTVGNEKDKSVNLPCYYLLQFENFTDWKNSADHCENDHQATLAAVETKDELTLLSSQLLVQLQHVQFNKFKVLSLRNVVYIYIYIDILLSDYLPTDRSPCADVNSSTIQNWIADDFKRSDSQRCGAWLYKFPIESQTFDKDSGNPNIEMDRSISSDTFTQGLVDILCGELLSKFALCKWILPKPITESAYPEARNTSIRNALQRGEYIETDGRLMSVADAIKSGNLNAYFPEIVSNLVFSCDDSNHPKQQLPYSFVCDYKQDCDNGRDEEICEYRACEISEYQCASSARCIPIEAICDLVRDCDDGSDEESCHHTCIGYLCSSEECIPKHWIGDGHIDCTGCDKTDENSDESISAVSELNQVERCVFICNRTQCVYPSQLNDGVVDCQGPEGPLDETIGALEHVNRCRTSNIHLTNLSDWAPRCVYVRDRYGSILGCRDKSHLQNCAQFTCPDGYVKCSDSYCIPFHYLNDGWRDCPGGLDETFAEYVCSSYYDCPSNSKCVHPDLICNGVSDCSEKGEDEFNCHVSCAPGFICIAGTVTVGNYDTDKPLLSLEFIDDSTRYLDLSTIDISFVISSRATTQLRNLIYVSFVNSSISSVGYDLADAIGRVSSIYWMNLSYNVIDKIPTNSMFRSTSNLRVLDLSHNRKLSVLQASAFDGSKNLMFLNLSYTIIRNLHQSAFFGLLQLELLNLSNTHIDSLLDKNFPDSIVIKTLDLRGTMIYDFKPNTFDGLSILRNLYTDTFGLCCSDVRGVAIPEHTCHAPSQSVSSCTDLINDPIQRVLLWVVGIVALFGNSVVIIFRIIWDREILRKPYGLFVLNLGLSDFIMGIYLIIIGGADSFYRGVYVWNFRKWRFSVACKFAGFLSTLSSETSMFLAFLITIDRLLVIKFPFGDYRISNLGMILLTVSAWLIGLILSIIPVLPIFNEDNIYTSNALCLGLPLTNDRPDGWGYSMAVFIVLNFTMFLIIALGQFLIYRAMSSHRSTVAQSSTRRSQDVAVAKQLSLVVLSDFLCWFPIGFMGLLALTGMELDREAYVWSAVLVLPVNSALNPLLYTIPVIRAKREKLKLDNIALENRI